MLKFSIYFQEDNCNNQKDKIIAWQKIYVKEWNIFKLMRKMNIPVYLMRKAQCVVVPRWEIVIYLYKYNPIVVLLLGWFFDWFW